MTDLADLAVGQLDGPPPPPPPTRLGPLQRFIAPLGLNRQSRPGEDHGLREEHSSTRTIRSGLAYGVSPSKTSSLKTDIPILAIDSNESKTRAILAGKEILKTVRVEDGRISEDFNLRLAITSQASIQDSPHGDSSARRREYLPARDVRWSYKNYSHIIATAASNGRIALYDANRSTSQPELARLHEHTGQVNKIDFDSFVGYLMLSGSSDKTMRMWDIRDTHSVSCRTKFDVRSGVRHVAWSPVEGNDFDIAVSTDNGLVQLWDARNNKGPTLSIHAHERGCYSLDWHPDGRHIVSGGLDKFVRVWDFRGERRQKPVFSLRAMQSVRNVKWRPPCWSAEVAMTGAWQTTQVATTYHVEDPRMHVWDFRRPLLPFREIDQYNSPANDLLWASKDLLWSCSDDGMFTQHDVNHAPHSDHTYPPGAATWLPDGGLFMVSEQRRDLNRVFGGDASAAFLNVAPERLGRDRASFVGGNQEEDEYGESPIDNLLSMSLKRKARALPGRSSEWKASSSRTPLSHATDALPPILPLDKAVRTAIVTMSNDQTGFLGTFPGVDEDTVVAACYALEFSSPALESERRANPNTILKNLSGCLLHNAEAAKAVNRPRDENTWRTIERIGIPELTKYADKNRAARVAAGVAKSGSDNTKAQRAPEYEKNNLSSSNLSEDNVQATNEDGTLERTHRPPSAHFSDDGKEAAIPTPQLRPLPPSSLTPLPRTQHEDPVLMEDDQDDLDNLQTLPPSVVQSHTTAKIAAQALADTSRPAVASSPTSHATKKDDLPHSASLALPPTSPKDIAQRSPLVSAKQQDERRAALKDFRMPIRQPLTLEPSTTAQSTLETDIHGSADSFSMFPESSSSSNMPASTGHGYESSASSQARHANPPPPSREHSMDSISSIEDDSPQKEDSVEVRDFSGEQSSPEHHKSSTDYGLMYDGAGDSKPVEEREADSPRRVPIEKRAAPRARDDEAQQDAEPVQKQALDPDTPVVSVRTTQSGIHMSNPLLRESSKPAADVSAAAILSSDALQHEYVFEDFRPIDISTYEPEDPFPFSTLPMLSKMILYYAESGVGKAQMAAHLILHFAPFFWAPEYRTDRQRSLDHLYTHADQLLRPDMAHRVLDGILLNHLVYLQQLGNDVATSFAALRKVAVDQKFPLVNALAAEEYLNSSTFTLADSFTMQHLNVENCPVCFGALDQGASQMVTTCSSCHHSAHINCLTTWFGEEGVGGRCATAGCTCDCAPGETRVERMKEQLVRFEERRAISGAGPRPGAMVKRDPIRVGASAAVKALSGGKKSVRVVTPGEEE